MKKLMTFFALIAFIFSNSFCDHLKEYKDAISSVKVETFKQLLKERHKVFFNNDECLLAEQTFQGYQQDTINDEIVLRYCNDFQTLSSFISECSYKIDKRLGELQKTETIGQKVSKYTLPVALMGFGSFFYYAGFSQAKDLFYYHKDVLKYIPLNFALGTLIARYGYSLWETNRKSRMQETHALNNGKKNLNEINETLRAVEISFVNHIVSMAKNYNTTLPANAVKALKSLSAQGLG